MFHLSVLVRYVFSIASRSLCLGYCDLRVGFRLSPLLSPLSAVFLRGYSFGSSFFSSALHSLAAWPPPACLSSFPPLPQFGCFLSYSIFFIPWFPPLVLVERMTPFLLLLRFPSTFVLFASVLRVLFLPFASFP